jgi:CheY-like chemotaxis protein
MTKRRKDPEGTASKKRFVLVVDNNQRDASSPGMLLQNLGYTSTLSRSGEGALELLAHVPPAFIVSRRTPAGSRAWA